MRCIASVVLTVTAGGALLADPAHAGGNGSAATAPVTYTVVAGDYLGGIAVKLSVKLSDLLATNKLTTGSLIYPGMKLLVPAGGHLPAAPAPAQNPAPLRYTVVAGDYLGGIAGKLGVTLTSLLTTNKLTTGSLIYPGMKLTVPTGGHLPAPVTSGGGNSGSPATNDRITTVLNFVRAQLGDPYKFNAAGPDEWDCSGLTMAAYAQIGISLPHYSGAQAMRGTAVNWTTEAIKPGDLVFLESYPGSGVINHVGIAISATQWIQAPRTGDVVRTGTIPAYRLVSVRRLVQGG